MKIKIALAGNPNCGKTTLFNALTGSNQFVGNWPGVTVEKKEGKLKKHDDVVITDLPGIYSLSPYTLEEVVARNYLIQERPEAILNIIDGTNLERKREMNNAKWTWFAIGYQCGFAYLVAFVTNQLGSIALGTANVFGIIVSIVLIALFIFLLVRPYKESTTLSDRAVKVK